MTIIERIQIIRENKKISRKEIAEKLYISTSTYRDIEYGNIRLSLENYIELCKILEINPMTLLNDSKDESFILLSNKDIEDLNRILNKINNQTINFTDNHGTVNITNEVNKKWKLIKKKSILVYQS